jgi:hypothetical protein
MPWFSGRREHAGKPQTNFPSGIPQAFFRGSCSMVYGGRHGSRRSGTVLQNARPNVQEPLLDTDLVPRTLMMSPRLSFSHPPEW